MIDGERRGYQAAYEMVSAQAAELARYGVKISMPSDQALGELATVAWTEFQSRGIAHIEPRELFLRGYAMAVGQLLHVFDVLLEEERSEKHVEVDTQ